MFGKDPGKAVRLIAKIMVWLMMAVGLVIGAMIAKTWINDGIREAKDISITEVALRWLGGFMFVLVSGAAGFGVGWLGSVVLYSFGDLVSTAHKISDDLEFLCQVKEDEIEAQRRRIAEQRQRVPGYPGGTPAQHRRPGDADHQGALPPPF